MSTRQRSLLGLLGVVIGTSSVIMLINIAGIIEHQILQQFKAMGTNIFSVTMNTYDEKSTGFNLVDLRRVMKDNKEVTSLVPVQSVNADINFRNKKGDRYYSVVATTPELFKLLNIDIDKGRSLTAFDTSEPYTVAGSSIYSQDHLSLGSVIRMGTNGFSILGINRSAGENMLLPFFPNDTFFINLKNARALTKNFKISTLVGTAVSDSKVGETADKLKRQFNHLYPGQNVSVRTAKTMIDQAKKQAQLLTILLAAIGSIALIVGGIGVMNVMLVSVAQRKTEIGLRIALGATGNDIRLLFLSEAITLCFIGGIIGTLLGLAVSVVFALKMSMPFIITWFALPTGIIISVVSGILSGVYPASQAAKMNPIEALRTE